MTSTKQSCVLKFFFAVLVALGSASAFAAVVGAQPLPPLKNRLHLAVQSAGFYQARMFLVQQGRVFKAVGSLRPGIDYCEALVTKVLPLGTEFPVQVDFLPGTDVDLTNLQAGVQLKCHQLQRPAIWSVEELQAILTGLVQVIPK